MTDIYTKLHLIKQSGHGVPIVVKQYGEKAFEFGTSFIIVTIPFEQPFAAKNTVSNATVIRNIAKLKAYGFVQRIGSDKTGKWVVMNQV